MSILFYDTETTGKSDFKLGVHIDQPRIVQIAAVLCGDSGDPFAMFSSMVYPEGYEIPKESTAIHKITTEKASQYGLMIGGVFSLMSGLARRADIIVAHNIDFDDLIMKSEALRQGKEWNYDSKLFCTMKATTPICKIPGRYRDFKWPSLLEAHTHLLGEGFDGAHSAMADVEACARVYFALRKANEDSQQAPQSPLPINHLP